MTERSEILEMMAALQLPGMRAVYDQIVTMSIKRQQGVERVIYALLKAEIVTKQARSINYQLGVAKLPLVKELAEDEAIAAADTLLLTIPNQLGVDYCAHVIDAVLRDVAPELGWR